MLPVDGSETAEKQPRQPKRLKPLESDGVRLSFGEDGKAKTKELEPDSSEDEDASDTSSLSPEGYIPLRAPGPGKPPRGETGAKDRNQLNTDIFASPSPSPSPSRPVPAKTASKASSNQVRQNAEKAPRVVQSVGSAPSTGASFRQPNLRLRTTDGSPSPKRRRLSLRDFASSSPEAESAAGVKKKAAVPPPTTEKSGALFRSQDSYTGVTDCFDGDESAGSGILGGPVVTRPACSAHTSSTAATTIISRSGPERDVPPADGPIEVTSHAVQALSPASAASEDDDDFDAWLESSVVVV